MTEASRIIPMLIVDNMQAALRFYAEVLGGTPIYQYPENSDPSFITLRCGNSDVALSLLRTTLPMNVSFRPAIGHRIQLCVNVADVDESVAALRSINSTVVLEPSDQPWGERAAYVEDPDGNLVLLVSRLKERRA
ncbi:MAG TPA: VOC family protein [Acidobacteriaceae bacterium]|nr:VOC family protein [Acidobacteriaceae bacterium]